MRLKRLKYAKEQYPRLYGLTLWAANLVLLAGVITGLAIITGLLYVNPEAVFAQRDTEIIVRQFVFDQVQTTTESAPISNVGQTQHSMFLRLEDAPGGGTCTDTGLSVFFEQGVNYRDDPSVISWEQFGDAVTPTEYGALGSTYRNNTSGVVHALRVNPDAFDTTECLLSVTYVGSVRPVPLLDIGASTVNFYTKVLNFLTVPSDPPCNVGDYFIFANSTTMTIRVCQNGVLSDILGGGGGGGDTTIRLLASDAVMGDATTGNVPTDNSRQKVSTTTGNDPFFWQLEFGASDTAFWTIAIPDNYSSDPSLTFWGVGSSAVGTQAFNAQLRCVTPNASDTWVGVGKSFGAANTYTAAGFSTFLDAITIPLTTDDDGMAAGDLCTLRLQLDPASANNFAFYRGVVTYTGS